MIGIEDEKRSGGIPPAGCARLRPESRNDPTTIVTTEEKSPLDFALRYARNGWRIFPLKAGTKRPRPEMTEWPRVASCDPATVERWWMQWPDSG